MNRQRLATTAAFFLAGAVLGYAILAAGPLPAIAALIFAILLLRRLNDLPEQPGSYLVGLGLAGAILLFLVVVGCRRPSCQFDALTPATLVFFLLVTAAGAWLLTRAAQKGRFAG